MRKLIVGGTFRASLTSAFILIMLAGPGTPVLAQQASNDDSAIADDLIEEITVTGSRIKRTEFTSPVPVQIINMDVQTLAGLIDTAEILQSSNLANNAPQLNNFFAGNPAEDLGGNGTNSIDLRGLGSGKTLVLLNGRRLNPAGTRGTVAAVDLNTIPSSIIQRIEILKDGASSVYGSDAIAGVVNMITRTGVDGFSGGVYFGAPFDSGGETSTADLSFGISGDRLSLVVGAEYYKREPLTRGDRSWARCSQEMVRDPETGERLDLIDPTTGEYKCYNTAANNYVINYGDYHLTGGQSRSIYDPVLGDWRVGSYAERQFDHPSSDLVHMIAPVERWSPFGFGDWHANFLGENTKGYFELMYNERRSNQTGGPRQMGITIEDSPFSPFYNDYGWAWDMSLLIPYTQKYSQEVDWLRSIVGFTGEWSNGWTWDVYAGYGRSEGLYSSTETRKDRLENMIDIVEVAPGVYDCAVNLEPGSDGRCIPLNPYAIIRDGLNSPGLFPQDILDYLWADDTGKTIYTQKSVSAYVSGDLFELPAGSLAAVLGVEARRESIDDTPSWDRINDNLSHALPTGITAGNDEVWELFAELEFPLLRDTLAAQDLTLNIAGRYSDYDTAGYDTTYRAGLNWSITDNFRLRSSYGTSFRAPSLYENFLNGQASASYLGDPCTEYRENSSPGQPVYENCQSEVGDADYWIWHNSLVVTSGNAGRIKPETSESLTAGVVLNFDAVDLGIALDYFDFKIEGEIDRYGADTVIAQCYNLPPEHFRQPGTICDFVGERGDDLIFLWVNDSYFNINQQYQEGIDLTMRYEFAIGELDFAADLRATKILEHTIELFDGYTEKLNGRTYWPEENGQLDLRAMTDTWTFYYGLEYIGGGSDYEYWDMDPETSIYVLDTPSVTYHNIGIRYEIDGWSAQFGVRNVANKEPPVVSVAASGNASSNSSYDRLGRSYFLRISKDFEGM